MAQLVVRHLEDDVKARLKHRAERHGRSMEEEVRHILRNALKVGNRPVARLGSRIAARFTKAGLTADLPELHGQPPRSAQIAGIALARRATLATRNVRHFQDLKVPVVDPWKSDDR